MMTIEEIRTGKEGQTFDLKSMVVCWQLAYQTRQER